MKCSKCGFISRRDFYRCPYCGHTNQEDFEGIRTRINLGHDFSAQVRTIVIVAVVNLFLLAVLLDWYLSFKYAITLWSYFVLFGSLVIMDVVSSKKNDTITAFEKIDIFLLGYLILCCGLCKIDGVFDARLLFPSIVIPAYIILSTLFSGVLFLTRKKTKLRPIWTEMLFFFRMTLGIVLFVFLLVNKNCLTAHPNGIFPYLEFNYRNATGDIVPLNVSNLDALKKLSEILIFVAFGASAILLVNYNILLVGSIFRKVKRIYGGERD